MDGQRTYDEGPWHYCGRCDEKTKIKTMRWQNGTILCPTCVDQTPSSPGFFERVAVEVLSDGQVEFQIDPKLVNPQDDLETDEDIVGYI